MVCRKITDLPHTAVQTLHPPFLQFIWQGNRLSRGLQGTSARAMASICVHRAQQTPPDIAPGHIRSRDVLQEEPQPATHSRQCPIPRFLANHLARQSLFYGPAGHISSRGGTDLCPSSTAKPSWHRSRAYRLARWFAGRSPTCHTRPCRACIPLSCNSSCTPIAFLRASRAHPLARWHQFVSIERPKPLQTALQGISARAMVCRRKNSFAKPSEPNTRSTAEKSGATSD